MLNVDSTSDVRPTQRWLILRDTILLPASRRCAATRLWDARAAATAAAAAAAIHRGLVVEHPGGEPPRLTLGSCAPRNTRAMIPRKNMVDFSSPFFCF